MSNLDTRRRINRLNQERIYIYRKYPTVETAIDKTDGQWIHITHFPIAHGWDRPEVELLIDIPAPGYPDIPPQWFWTDRNITTLDGRNISQFFDHFFHNNEKYASLGWGHFCVHIRGSGSWRPASNVIGGHSLLSYLNLISLVFRDQKRKSAA